MCILTCLSWHAYTWHPYTTIVAAATWSTPVGRLSHVILEVAPQLAQQLMDISNYAHRHDPWHISANASLVPQWPCRLPSKQC